MYQTHCKHSRRVCIFCEWEYHGFEDLKCRNCNAQINVFCKECLEEYGEDMMICEHYNHGKKYCDYCIEKLKKNICEYLIKKQNLSIEEVIDNMFNENYVILY